MQTIKLISKKVWWPREIADKLSLGKLGKAIVAVRDDQCDGHYYGDTYRFRDDNHYVDFKKSDYPPSKRYSYTVFLNDYFLIPVDLPMCILKSCKVQIH